MKNNKIKILHLEDLETDVELVQRILKKEGLKFDLRTVDTRDDYTTALKEFLPDIILSDHSLPDFNSLQALSILKQEGLTIPFILVTGAVSEEFAAKVMQQGADDYILKDRPQRLGKAIVNALEWYDVKRERLKTETHLRNIFDHSLDVLCSIDGEGAFVEVNAASEAIWGYKPSELVGKKYMDMVFEEDIEKTSEAAANIMLGARVTNFENRYIRNNGSLVDIVWSARWDSATQIMYCVARDATEKKNAEKIVATGRQRLLDLFMNAPVSMCILKGEEHTFELANPMYLQLIGKKNVTGIPVRQALPEIEGQGYLEILDDCYKSGAPYIANEALVRLNRNGNSQLTDRYLNFIYQPYSGKGGKVEEIFYFGVDITEQVEARKTIQQSFELLQSASARQTAILNALPANIALLNKDGVIIAVNQAWQSYGSDNNLKSTNSAIGSNYIAVSGKASGADAEAGKKMAKGIAEVLEGKLKEFSLEYPCHSPTEKRWFSVKVSPTDKDNSGGAVIMHVNITERKLAEAKIRKSEANLSAIIENTDAHIYSLDRKFRYLTFNSRHKDTMKAIYGRDVKPGANVFQFLKEIDRPEATEWEQIYVQALSGKPMQFEKNYSANNIPSYYSFSINPIWENKKVIGLSCFARDTTQQKLVDEEIRTSEQRYRQISQNPILGIVWFSVEGKILNANVAFCNMLGYEHLEIMDMHFTNYTHAGDIDKQQVIIEQLVARKIESYRFEKRYITKSGEEISGEIILSSVKNKEGGVKYLIGVVQNITARKKAEAEIVSLNATLENRIRERTIELEKANRELETFSHTVSHDLKTPLRSISGFANILLKNYTDKLDAPGLELLQIVESSAKRMNQLINDLLNFSRLDKNAMHLSKVNIFQMAGAVSEEVKMGYPDLKTEIIISALDTAVCDPALMRQVLTNLISNAVKYSSKKEHPVVEIGMQKTTGESIYYVKDNGAGFDMKNIGKLFGVFQRLHGQEDFEGTGVGLATVQRILLRHNGRIWAEARKDHGATFYFTLPNGNDVDKTRENEKTA
jgi:PAS domain S-box-containing protein